MRAAQDLASGIASLPSSQKAFAATQGAWRFLNNERIRLSALVAPLRAVGCERVQARSAPFALLVHDWSKLTYHHPARKRDLAQLTHAKDMGYELTTALLVAADDGSPLAPMEMHLRGLHGTVSTRDPAPRTRNHLEQVLPTMNASAGWGVSKPLLHVIDREADSIDHYRRWDAAGHKFLIRADHRRVRWEGRCRLLGQIACQLRRRQALAHVGATAYQGQSAQLWVAETQVELYRPAKKSRQGVKFTRSGRVLTLRFVVVEVRNDQGQRLAEWFLLSNVSLAWAPTSLLAYCYYWRWRIESFFKLLKSHGLQWERWQQETSLAIARRLLVAAMTCVLVWQLQADPSPRAIDLKNVLVRLSGRQTKRKRPHTAPALLAGLWVLLSMLALLEHISLHDLHRLASFIPYLHSG